MDKTYSGRSLTKDQIALVNEMGCYTHNIWTQQKADEVGALFGFEVKTWTFRNQPTVPKGAHLSDADGIPIDQMVGVDSEGILSQIAEWLGHKFSDHTRQYNGRGFRVSAMAREIMEVFGPVEDDATD